MSAPQYEKQVSPVSAGLQCRCPHCGRGKLYRGYLTVAERCSECGLDFSKADSGDGPAFFIILILGAILVPLQILVEVVFEPPYWVHMLLWPPLVVIGALWLLRPFKAVLIALQFHHKASESGAQDYE